MLRIFIAIAALISLTAPASAEIYKCRLSNGKTEISNVPCPTGSNTLTVRPDEPVAESSRRAAEQDVERMRAYVEKREAAQRAEQAAEREQQRAASQQRQDISAARTPRQYGSADECLRDVGQMALDSSERSRMEAECRNITRPQTVYVPVAVPIHPSQHAPRQHIQPQPAPKAERRDGPGIAATQLKK